jgi:tetratricopeptide (TPR) repeat protein
VTSRRRPTPPVRPPRPAPARPPAPSGSGRGASGPPGGKPHLWTRHWLLAGIVFTVALLWRLGYLARLDASILGRSLVSDSEIYWTWATWLGQHGWIGKHPFYMGPLYPYSVAGVRAVLGDSIPAVLAVQAVFGAAACALLADTVRRFAGPAIGLAVGLGLAFYETAVFLDGLVLMESQLFFLEALLLWWVALRPPESRRTRTLVAVGALLGLLAAGRATAALLLPVAIAFFTWPRPLAGWRRGLALGLGFALVAAPIAARNYALGREWIPFTYNGGLNLYIGNSPQANGTFILVTGTQVVASTEEPEGVGIDGREYLRLTTGRALSPAASSRHWTDLALAWIREHPGKAAGLALRRLAMMWNRIEYPQVENVEEFREVAGPLGLPGVGTFAVLGPLALLGAFLVVTRRRGGPAGAFALAYAVTVTLAIAPFFVTDRYRHHLVPAAIVLAGIALAEIVAAVRARRPDAVRPRVLLAVLAAAAVLVHLPVPGISAAKRDWGIASDLGTRYLARGEAARAIEQFERALAIERAGRLRPAAGRSDTRAVEQASLYNNYALALVRAGRADEARAWFERALALAPDNAQIMGGLAALEDAAGNLAAADSLYRRMGGAVRGDAAGALGRGRVAAREGRLDEAAGHFREAARLDPGSGEAWGALVRIELQAGRAAAADSVLAIATRAGWRDDGARLHEALVRAVRGDPAAARRLRAGVSPAAIAADPVLGDVDAMLERVLARP